MFEHIMLHPEWQPVLTDLTCGNGSLYIMQQKISQSKFQQKWFLMLGNTWYHKFSSSVYLLSITLGFRILEDHPIAQPQHCHIQNLQPHKQNQSCNHNQTLCSTWACIGLLSLHIMSVTCFKLYVCVLFSLIVWLYSALLDLQCP